MSELREALRQLHGDVREDIDRAQTETNRRLDRIDRHLEVLNGRVGTGERDQARTDEAIDNLSRVVFHRRHSDHAESADGETAKVSRRDVQMFVAGASGAIAIIALIWKALPAFLKAVTP